MIGWTVAITGWHPHWDSWLVLGLVGAGYIYTLRAWGPHEAAGGVAATPWQKTSFAAGLATLWIASDWPIHGYDPVLFSVHMVQHLLYAFVAAPLLILGMPTWLLRRLLRRPLIEGTFRALTRPLTALVIFNGWMLLYHWPPIVNLSVESHSFHLFVHVIWVGAALIVWWPVVSPLPEHPHLSYLARLGYIFGLTLLPSIPATLLTFGQVPFYQVYVEAARVTGLLVVDDQQLAGLAMKIGGGALLWTAFTVLFFLWAREEETGAPDPLYWREIAPEVRQMEKVAVAVEGVEDEQ